MKHFIYLILLVMLSFVFTITNCKKNKENMDKDNKAGLGLLWLSQQNQSSSFLLEIPPGLAQ